MTKTPRRDASGNAGPDHSSAVNDYTIQSQLGGISGCDGTCIMPVGTVAHETGHVFGLPDLYDTDKTSRTEGIGEWGLMGSGNFARSYSPASYDAWSLAEMGWVTRPGAHPGPGRHDRRAAASRHRLPGPDDRRQASTSCSKTGRRP